ncbi:hypothetical protein ACFXPS_42510 [Nocardia sp. NPDC059091]|uniref:hypothetical protein n=1 Tax=Nocardia sp. NPDC059091 TaxID=3346724 RepID=UPI0036CB8EF0
MSGTLLGVTGRLSNRFTSLWVGYPAEYGSAGNGPGRFDVLRAKRRIETALAEAFAYLPQVPALNDAGGQHTSTESRRTCLRGPAQGVKFSLR